MAAAVAPAQPLVSTGERKPDNRQVTTPANLTYAQSAQGCHHVLQAPSPASTESLLGTVEGYTLSSIGPAFSSMPATPALSLHGQEQCSTQIDLFLKFSALLERGLANTAAQISRDMKADFANLGTRMEAIESKLDITVSHTNQNAANIQTLQDQLDTA